MDRQVFIGLLRHTENINMTSLHVTLKHIGTKMGTAQVYLLNTITNVLGLSVKQREVLSDDGFENI